MGMGFFWPWGMTGYAHQQGYTHLCFLMAVRGVCVCPPRWGGVGVGGLSAVLCGVFGVGRGGSGETGQGKESLISTFVCFLTAAAKV